MRNKLSKLDPRVKIFVTIFIMVLAFLSSSWLILVLLLFSSFVLSIFLGCSISHIVKKLRASVLMVVLMFLIQVLFAPSVAVLVNSALGLKRIIIVIMYGFVLVTTTTPMETILVVDFGLKPFEKLGLKAGAMKLTTRLMLRFIPSLLSESRKILKAQSSRGLDLKGEKLWVKMRLIAALLLPVFVIAIKSADGLADTMAVRGYLLNAKRTNYRVIERAKS